MEPDSTLLGFKGFLSQLAVCKQGSMFIQKRLEAKVPEERALLFKELFMNDQLVLWDSFGNYVVQLLLDYGS